MTQTNKQGMRLRPTEDPRKKNIGWLLQALVSLMTCMVLILTITELAGYGLEYVTIVMLVTALYLCIMYGLLLRTKRQYWFFIGVLILMLVLTLVCRAQVLEGYRLFWKQVSDAMVSGTGWVLPEWELQLPKEQHDLCLTMFTVLLSAAVTLITCALTNWAPVLAVLIPGAAMFGMAVLGTELSFVHLLLILGVSVLILMYNGWGGKNGGVPVAMSWMLGGILAAILIAAAMLPGVKSWTQSIGTWMQQTIHEKKYETEHTTLPEGDFSDYQESDENAEVALVVTMENPEMLYLRGFTGSVFEDNTWKPLEKDVLAKNKQLLYWLNLNAFDPNSQFDAASAQTELTRNTVTIQNMGACSRYRYVPFSVSRGEYMSPENLNTEGVLSEGERVYTYSTLFGGAESVSQVLQNLQSSNDSAVLKYRKAESGYRAFVNHFYLQVPEEVRQLLAEQWDTIAAPYGGADNLTLQQGQECALVFLSRCFPESGTPEDMELPLDIAKGTSYQYATVAAMTLRYFGIPARYAEGYFITKQMAASVGSGETLTVDSSCARAWVEVYQDGIGWIPMDLTPGLGEMVQETQEDSEDKDDGDTVNEELDPEEAEEERPMASETEVSDPDGGSVVRIMLEVLSEMLRILLILALIFLLLWLRRRLRNQRREKKFRDADQKNAVAWIFADTAVILEKLGFDRGNGSMRELCTPAEEQFGIEYSTELKNMIDLNDRAMFSSRSMEEEHREAALTFRDHTIEKINTEMKWYKRLWLKWVRCLY